MDGDPLFCITLKGTPGAPRIPPGKCAHALAARMGGWKKKEKKKITKAVLWALFRNFFVSKKSIFSRPVPNLIYRKNPNAQNQLRADKIGIRSRWVYEEGWPEMAARPLPRLRRGFNGDVPWVSEPRGEQTSPGRVPARAASPEDAISPRVLQAVVMADLSGA